MPPRPRPPVSSGRAYARLSAGVAGFAAAGLLAGLAGPAYAKDPGEAFDPASCGEFQRNDPLPSWSTNRLQVVRAHQLATGRGVTIAVIDTGIDTHRNPALTVGGQPIVAQQFNYAATDRGSNGGVDCAHGTRVASLIAGRAEPGVGTDFIGVAPDARIIGLRALQAANPQQGPDANRPEPLEPTIRAIRKAIELKVDIINISQQGSDSPEYRAAVRDAIAQGIVVVAAAGNHGGDGPLPYPAAYPGVIAVGMSDLNDRPHERSQFHEGLDITVAAPGVDVLAANPSGAPGQSWQTDTGTSYAAPLVTGTVALLLEREPGLRPAEVRERLRASADRPAAAVPDRQLGYGVVNPYRTLTDVPATKAAAAAVPVRGHAPDPARPATTTPAGVFAVGLGAAALGGTGLAAALTAAYPAGRRRRWQPAE